MPFCKNCGVEISIEQEENFNNLCPDCIRLVKYGKRRGGGCIIFVGIWFLIAGVPFVLIELIIPFTNEFYDFQLYNLGIYGTIMIIGILIVYIGIRKRRSFKTK